MSLPERLDAVLQLLEGRVTVDEVASRFSVAPSEVETWRSSYLAGARSTAVARTSNRSARAVLLVAALLSVGVGIVATTAHAQSCTQTLPSPLKTFCADAPALATDVNTNLQGVVNFISQKVGTVGTSTVTLTGALTGTTANFSGNVNSAGLISTGTVSGSTVSASGGGTIATTGLFNGGSLSVSGELTANNNTWASTNWLASSMKTPAGGSAVGNGGTPGAGWSIYECSNGDYVCGIAFTHAPAQNGTHEESVTIRCCAL